MQKKKKIESAAAAARKDPTPPIDGQKSHGVDVSGNAYAQEHDSTSQSQSMQSKDDAGNPDQVAGSFGDMNISVAVSRSFTNGQFN